MSTAIKSPRKTAKVAATDPEKLARKNAQEQQRRIKPGECLKYILVMLDPECLCGSVGAAILKQLTEMGIKYEIRSQNIPRTVLWQRCELLRLTDNDEMLAVSDKHSLEKQIMLIMLGDELVESIKDKTLHNRIGSVQEIHPEFSISLVIFGLKSFCRENPKAIKRSDIEKSLTEVQIIYNCSHRLLETGADVGVTIAQFSKAIAEMPFKKQQLEKHSDANLFLANDNKDCVRVEGSSGLSRLWQQHLTRLPMVTLETAEAIMSKYPNPKMMFEDYDISLDGPDMLADLKVRRAGGPLTKDRRIGAELSRKMHTLYTSLDPNEEL